MESKYAGKLAEMERRVLEQRGSLDPNVRRAAAGGEVLNWRPRRGRVESAGRGDH